MYYIIPSNNVIVIRHIPYAPKDINIPILTNYEDKYLNEALYKFEDIILTYSKSNELLSKINEIRGNLRDDKYKLESFKTNLQMYVEMVQNTDEALIRGIL